MIKFSGPEGRIIRVNDKVNDKEQMLLALLNKNSGYTVAQIADLMNVSRKTVAVYLKTLKEKGAIERIGSARKGYWKIIK